MTVIGLIRGSGEVGVEWNIDGFTSLNAFSWYNSPRFFFAGVSWCFQVLPLPFHGTTSRLILLRLFRCFGGPRFNLELTLGLKTQGGSHYGERRGTKEFRSWDDTATTAIRMEHHRLSELLPDNSLTVVCSIHQADGDADEESESESSAPKCGLHQDFKQLFLSQEACDVVIRVKDRKFKAHRIILMARSPVLAAALRSDMKEKATGIVDIDDLDPSAFSDFLCFLYCEEVDSGLSAENVFELYTAADKYDVPNLRTKCVEFMRESLCIDTFCDVMRVALLHSETELFSLCTDFFIKNYQKIFRTVKWQTFMTENPTQCKEFFDKFGTTVESSFV